METGEEMAAAGCVPDSTGAPPAATRAKRCALPDGHDGPCTDGDPMALFTGALPVCDWHGCPKCGEPIQSYEPPGNDLTPAWSRRPPSLLPCASCKGQRPRLIMATLGGGRLEFLARECFLGTRRFRLWFNEAASADPTQPTDTAPPPREAVVAEAPHLQRVLRDVRAAAGLQEGDGISLVGYVEHLRKRLEAAERQERSGGARIVHEVSKLSPRPGDLLVLRIDDRARERDINRLREEWSRFVGKNLPGVRACVVDRDMNVELHSSRAASAVHVNLDPSERVITGEAAARLREMILEKGPGIARRELPPARSALDMSDWATEEDCLT